MLPRGVTGFRSRRSGPLPETDFRAFAGICRTAARMTGGRLGPVTRTRGIPNFHAALLARGSEQVMLLGNQHAPLIATALPAPPGATITFVDDARIRGALAVIMPAPFRLLALRELQAPLDRVDCTALDEAELREAGYWKPATAGEQIFNCWD